MTESAINEKISAWFEPRPPVFSNLESGTSKAGVWVYQYQIDPDKPPIEQVKGWTPLDYFHSEDANARLLEAMPDALLHRINSNTLSEFFGKVGDDDEWGCKPTHDAQTKNYTWHKDRKTVVVLAFCKFAGIEP